MQASEVNEYVKRQIQTLKQTPRARDNIWKRFQEGFKGYTVDTFKLAHRITLRDLRDVLATEYLSTHQEEVSLAQTLYKLA